MATRAIKQLTKNDDLKKLSSQIPGDADDSDAEGSESAPTPINKFDLLSQLGNEEPEEDVELDDDESETAKPPSATNSKPKRKQKQKKKGGGFKYVSSNVNENDEPTTTTAAAAASQAKTSNPANAELNEKVKRVLQIETKYLNADNEMTRIFGARIVQSERNENQRNRRPTLNRFKHNSIVNRKPTWPEFRKQGLSMKVVKENADDNSIEFAFEHSVDYQKIQFLFLDAVESLDHNNIINVLHFNPYHIDSLIQMSEVGRIHDDTQMAADLIERSIYAFQNTFHASFNLSKSQGGQLRLDYNRAENRGLFIALFKHAAYISGKACYRTALELCKLLLGLDYANDPLACLLLVDFYAMRAAQYDYLIAFYECFVDAKCLDLMPNMCMSVALAYFNKKNSSDYAHVADDMLRQALLKFPMLLMPLLDKCGIMPDKRAEASSIFSKVAHLKTPAGLKYLIDLYVERMYHEWKISENLEWLEANVKKILDDEKNLLPKVNEFKKRWQTLFTKVPTNVYRHLILSDLKEVPPNLPPSYPSSATYTFDPVPPKNSIVSYTRPERTRSSTGADQPGSAADSLLTFFQSLMPNFNAQQQQQQQANNANNRRGDEGGAAAAADAPRFNMNQMMERLRDFLVNVENNFPAAAQPHDENNADGDDGDINNEPHDPNEYD